LVFQTFLNKPTTTSRIYAAEQEETGTVKAANLIKESYLEGIFNISNLRGKLPVKVSGTTK